MGKTQFVTQFFLKGITCVATVFSLLGKNPCVIHEEESPRCPSLYGLINPCMTLHYQKDEIYVCGHLGMGGYLTLSLTSLKIGPLGMRLGPTITARNSSFSRATR